MSAVSHAADLVASVHGTQQSTAGSLHWPRVFGSPGSVVFRLSRAEQGRRGWCVASSGLPPAADSWEAQSQGPYRTEE